MAEYENDYSLYSLCTFYFDDKILQVGDSLELGTNKSILIDIDKRIRWEIKINNIIIETGIGAVCVPSSQTKKMINNLYLRENKLYSRFGINL